jgi:hypothetical protein
VFVKVTVSSCSELQYGGNEKMKKLLVVLTLMVVVLVFSAGAFAQVCTNCKGTLRNVPCPVAAAQAVAACGEFDYDLNTALDGYCTFSGLNNYRAIFHICDCPDPTAFIAGLVLDVRMTILVNGVAGAHGAYWSGIAATPANINFDTAATAALACAIAAHAGPPSAFLGTLYFLSDGVTASVPLATAACPVPAANQATVMLADNAGVGGYTVTGAEGSYWWIDIPQIRIDPAVIASGAIVSVRIELIDHAAAGICPTCSICECTIEVARACCAAAAPAGNLRFPYFTSLTAGTWWNGISIINPTAAAGTATLTAFVQDGTMDTAVVAVPAQGVFVDLLSNITWAGTGTGGLPCYIAVLTDYAGPDGFAMIANGSESMGYLPRVWVFPY